MEQKRILVLGGTGHYGREIVASLVDKRAPVRVLTRSAGRARRILGDAPELIEGDLADPAVIRAALGRVAGIVIAVSAFSPAEIRRIKAVEQDAVIAALDLARASGVKRVVFISVFDIREDVAGRHKISSGSAKLAVERYLAASDFNWTVLGAPPSMEIFLSLLGFIKLLNDFPPEVAARARLDLALLKKTFRFRPTTLERLASLRRRLEIRG